MKAFRWVVLAEEGKTFVEIPKNLNAIPYILDGEVTLNENFSYKGETLLHFRNDGSGFSFKALEPALTKRFQGSRVPKFHPVTERSRSAGWNFGTLKPWNPKIST